MADHAEEGDNDGGNIFIYRGGRAPLHVTHVRIDESVDEIEKCAFYECEHLVQVDTHDGIRRVRKMAFHKCRSLRRINLKSAVEIDDCAFSRCYNLESVEFGDDLETIGRDAFWNCSSLKLKHLKLPSVITIGGAAFYNCEHLKDIELSERLETIGERAFQDCESLHRIAIPLTRELFLYDDEWERYSQFEYCDQLVTVDLVGWIHKTVASLHMESWRTDMEEEINRINQVLPNTPDGKTEEIRQWMISVIEKMDHFKAEHYRYVKEGTTLLELALWKAKLLGEKEDRSVEGKTKKARVDSESTRKERRITCGADIVIKNVVSFLELE